MQNGLARLERLHHLRHPTDKTTPSQLEIPTTTTAIDSCPTHGTLCTPPISVRHRTLTRVAHTNLQTPNRTVPD